MNDHPKHTDPHWDGGLLVAHADEVRRALDLLPPDVEARVQNILANAPHVRRPGFMLAFTIGTLPYDLTDRDLKHLVEAMNELGYHVERPPWWQIESYTPQDPQSTELLQLIYDTGLMAWVNAAILHFHGLALGVNQEDGVVNRLDLHRTTDPEGVWFDEELTRVGRQKLLKAGLLLGTPRRTIAISDTEDGDSEAEAEVEAAASEVTYTAQEVEELASLMYTAGQGGRDGDPICERFLANHGQRR